MLELVIANSVFDNVSLPSYDTWQLLVSGHQKEQKHCINTDCLIGSKTQRHFWRLWWACWIRKPLFIKIITNWMILSVIFWLKKVASRTNQISRTNQTPPYLLFQMFLVFETMVNLFFCEISMYGCFLKMLLRWNIYEILFWSQLGWAFLFCQFYVFYISSYTAIYDLISNHANDNKSPCVYIHYWHPPMFMSIASCPPVSHVTQILDLEKWNTHIYDIMLLHYFLSLRSFFNVCFSKSFSGWATNLSK